MLVATSTTKCSLAIPLSEKGEQYQIIKDNGLYYPIHPEGTNLWMVDFDENGWDFTTPQQEKVIVALRERYPQAFEHIQQMFEDCLQGERIENDEEVVADFLADAGFEILNADTVHFNLEPFTWVFDAHGDLRLPLKLDGRLTHTIPIEAGDYIVSLGRIGMITGNESRIERLNRMPVVELWRQGTSNSRFMIESTYLEHTGGGDLTLDDLLPKIGDEYYNEYYYYGSKQPPEINLVNFHTYLTPIEGNESRLLYSHTGIPLYTDDAGNFKLPEFIETELGLAYEIQPNGLVGTVESTRIEGEVSKPIIQLSEELLYGKEEEEIAKMNQDIITMIQKHSDELMGLVLLP